MKNKFYNGKEITKENLIPMIGECIEENWKNSDLLPLTERIFEEMYKGYEYVEDDIENILGQLKAKTRIGYIYPEPNLQDVEIIISEGEWNFNNIIRKRNIMINKAGGGSGKNTVNYRVSLPAPWMQQMGITEEDREVILSFDGEKIIIEKGL